MWRSELKEKDFVKGEPVECPSCHNYMTFKERLKNGRSKAGKYRRRKFICDDCGHEDIVYADGFRDIEPYKKEDELLKKLRKSKEDYVCEVELSGGKKCIEKCKMCQLEYG